MVGKRGLFDEKRRVPAPAQDEEGERSITVWLRSRPAAEPPPACQRTPRVARHSRPHGIRRLQLLPHEQQRALAFDFDRVLGKTSSRRTSSEAGCPPF